MSGTIEPNEVATARGQASWPLQVSWTGHAQPHRLSTGGCSPEFPGQREVSSDAIRQVKLSMPPSSASTGAPVSPTKSISSGGALSPKLVARPSEAMVKDQHAEAILETRDLLKTLVAQTQAQQQPLQGNAALAASSPDAPERRRSSDAIIATADLQTTEVAVALQSKLEEVSTQNAALEQQNRKYEDQIGTLKVRLDSTRKQLDQKNYEIGELKKQSSQEKKVADAKLNEGGSKLQDSAKENRHLKQKLHELGENMRAVEKERNRAASVGAVLTPGEFLRMASNIEGRQNFSEENAYLRRGFADLETDCAIAQEVIRILRGKWSAKEYDEAQREAIAIVAEKEHR